MTASAEERFPQLTLDDLDDEQRRIAAPIIEFIGGIVGPFNSTLRAPVILERSFSLGEHLLYETTLPRRLVEMAILIRARSESSEFEWLAHHRRALDEGLSEQVCEALREGRRPDGMAPDEAALFDFAVEAVRRNDVSDATFERARAHFGERGVVELTYILGFYAMVALVLGVARVEAPEAQLPALDDPFGL